MSNLLHTKDDEYETVHPEGEIGRYVTAIRVPKPRPRPPGCTEEMLHKPIAVNEDGTRTYAVWVEWSRDVERRAHVTMTKAAVDACEARVAEEGAKAKETADERLRRSAYLIAIDVKDNPRFGCTRRNAVVEWVDPEPARPSGQ